MDKTGLQVPPGHEKGQTADLPSFIGHPIAPTVYVNGHVEAARFRPSRSIVSTGRGWPCPGILQF